jgi:hypothetical protein
MAQGWMTNLKNHLISRGKNIPFDGDEQLYSTSERAKLDIVKGRMYMHQHCRINYTRYDLQRDQDSVNSTTRSGIMLQAHDDQPIHPFWYAQIVGIFHVNVSYDNTAPVKMDVLWVRWMGLDPTYPCGWKKRRLPRVGFVPDDGDSPAFGFLDPAVVIREIHLPPAFHHGRTEDLLEPSIARWDDEDNKDWQYFYVNM